MSRLVPPSRQYHYTKIHLREGFITPIPMKYDVCGETEQGDELKVGSLYSLQAESCDGFEMTKRVYTCKGIVKTFKGITLDATIMKQVEGEESTIFSLTRLDCKLLGIEYEPDLQLFPINFNWNPMVRQEIRDYNPNNLGTYKPSPLTKTITQMHIFMHNVRYNGNDTLITPYGTTIPIPYFLESLQVKWKDEALNAQHPIAFKPLLTGGKDSNFFDTAKDGINFMLFFSNSSQGKGVDPSLFEGRTFDDLFQISWNDVQIQGQRPSPTDINRERLAEVLRNPEQRRRLKEGMESIYRQINALSPQSRHNADNISWTYFNHTNPFR